MQFELKALSPEALPGALAKARTYRLLNEPLEAESICRDVLEVAPDDQEALVILLLALTDQFETVHAGSAASEARRLVEQLADDYARAYYAGIVSERRAKALVRGAVPGYGPQAYEWLREAMNAYERAEALRPRQNDDPILRWNACARLVMRDSHLEPRNEGRPEPLLLE